MDLDAQAVAFGVELDNRTCFADRLVLWPDGPVRARYFRDGPFPAALVGSARAVVFRRSKVVVVRDRSGARHVQPGGHIEPGETTEAALRRELAEETGWRVGALSPFCFSFVEPVGEGRTWVGAVHVLFVAEAIAYDGSMRDRTQMEVGSSLVSIRRALLELPEQADILRAAIEARRSAR